MSTIGELAIFDCSVQYNGKYAVLIDRDSQAHVYDCEAHHVITVISVDWDNGGERVAIAESSQHFLTASFKENRVSLYSLPTGEPLWTVKVGGHPQQLLVAPHSGHYVVVRDRGGALTLSQSDGQVLSRIHRIKYACFSHVTDHYIVDEGRLQMYDTDPVGRSWSQDKIGFATLSADFSGDTVFVAEAGGPLRAFDLSSGYERWRIAPRAQHYLQVRYCKAGGYLVGVKGPLEHGAVTEMESIDPLSGAVMQCSQFGNRGELGMFIRQGRALLLFDGTIVDTCSHRLVS